MPKRTVNPRLSWRYVFVQEWMTLVKGRADIEDVVEMADDLVLKNKHRDPRKVAAKHFESVIAPRRELIPGFNAP